MLRKKCLRHFPAIVGCWEATLLFDVLHAMSSVRLKLSVRFSFLEKPEQARKFGLRSCIKWGLARVERLFP